MGKKFNLKQLKMIGIKTESSFLKDIDQLAPTRAMATENSSWKLQPSVLKILEIKEG